MENLRTFEMAMEQNVAPMRLPRIHSISVESASSFPGRQARGTVSELACESLLFLADRLGPYLCSKYLVDNLLRMLIVCYADADSLETLSSDQASPLPVPLSVANRFCLGDERAAKVVHCLRQIACLYGEQMVLLQYLPFVRNCIHSAGRGLTVKVQGGLLASIMLLQQTLPLLADKEFTANLQEPVLKELVSRAIRITGSLNCSFPAGQLGRSLTLSKLLDLLYTLGVRLGFENTRVKMATVLQQFFAPFSKVFSADCQRPIDAAANEEVTRSGSPAVLSSSMDGPSSFVEIRRDTRTNEFTLGTPVRVAGHGAPISRPESPLLGHAKPGSTPSGLSDAGADDEKLARVRQELAGAYSVEMAHLAYVTLGRLAGGLFLKENLYNGDLIIDLYERFEAERLSGQETGTAPDTGRAFFSPTLLTAETQLLAAKPARHLKGSWLSYWEHEKGRDEANKGWFFKHMRLMGYRGHTAAVRGIQVLNNESSFFSYSKDKTVRLWTVRNNGEGEANGESRFVYRKHQKPLLFAGYISSVRFIASIDGVAHLWDPFSGAVVRTFSAPNPMQCGALFPTPSSCLLTGEGDGFVRLIDARAAKYAAKWHTAAALGGVGVASAASLRHLAVSPNGWTVACATAGGALTWLDTRSGIVNPNNANAPTGLRFGDNVEIQLLRFVAPHLLLVASSDLALRLFSFLRPGAANNPTPFPPEVRQTLIYDQHREIVTCCDLTPRRELVLGTASSRLGVYASPDGATVAPAYAADKLRPSLMRGTPTALALLPSNQLVLLGSDSGHIVLLA